MLNQCRKYRKILPLTILIVDEGGQSLSLKINPILKSILILLPVPNQYKLY